MPENKKKVIFFTIMIISCVIAIFFGVILTKNDIVKIRNSAKAISFPKIDMSGPEINMPNLRIDDVVSSESGNIFQNQNFDLNTGVDTEIDNVVTPSAPNNIFQNQNSDPSFSSPR